MAERVCLCGATPPHRHLYPPAPFSQKLLCFRGNNSLHFCFRPDNTFESSYVWDREWLNTWLDTLKTGKQQILSNPKPGKTWASHQQLIMAWLWHSRFPYLKSPQTFLSAYSGLFFFINKSKKIRGQKGTWRSRFSKEKPTSKSEMKNPPPSYFSLCLHVLLFHIPSEHTNTPSVFEQVETLLPW